MRRKSTSWSQDIIKKIQEHFGRINNLSILNVGGNNGLEIDDIFKDKTGSSFTILDISDEALRNGQTLYPSFVFQQGNMEKDYLEDKQYDICLCLRTIQSRGASRQDTLIQISKHVKPQGMVIVTIPNGYLVNGTEVRKGLYDHKTKSFFRRRPNEMANKVEAKLQDYGFSETGIQTIETEMLVWGIKGVEK